MSAGGQGQNLRLGGGNPTARSSDGFFRKTDGMSSRCVRCDGRARPYLALGIGMILVIFIIAAGRPA